RDSPPWCLQDCERGVLERRMRNDSKAGHGACWSCAGQYNLTIHRKCKQENSLLCSSLDWDWPQQSPEAKRPRTVSRSTKTPSAAPWQPTSASTLLATRSRSPEAPRSPMELRLD